MIKLDCVNAWIQHGKFPVQFNISYYVDDNTRYSDVIHCGIFCLKIRISDFIDSLYDY